MIPGIPQADSQELLELILTHPHVQKVMLYGSRTLGHQHSAAEADHGPAAAQYSLMESDQQPPTPWQRNADLPGEKLNS